MPRLTKLDHGSICVGDIDEAVAFYGGVLGLAQIPRPDFGFPGAWFDASGTPVHLTTNGTLRGAESPIRANESHLAFQVDDVEAMIQHLDGHGVAVWELPDSPAALRQVFFNDPWGNMIAMIVY